MKMFWRKLPVNNIMKVDIKLGTCWKQHKGIKQEVIKRKKLME